MQQKVKLTRACYGLAFRVPFWAWLRHYMPKKPHSIPAVNAGVSNVSTTIKIGSDEFMKVYKKVIFAVIVVGLVSSNILSITNAKFHDNLSDLLSKIPISDFMAHSKSKKYNSMETENTSLKRQNETFRKEESLRKVKIAEAQKISKRVALRTAKNVSLNVSSVVVESIPYVGIAAVIAVTAADVHAGCETIKDNNELLNLLGVDRLSDDEASVCGMKVPTELEIRKKIESYKMEFNDAVGGTIYEILN